MAEANTGIAARPAVPVNTANAPTSLTRATTQLATFVRGLTTRQKVTLVGGGLVVLTTVLVFAFVLAKPDFKALYSGLNPSDAQSIASRLAAKNIQYELSGDATGIRVRAEDLDKARLEVASKGMPQSGRLGFELFDKANWAGSDFAEKVNYQRALEGELERTIQAIGEVEAVRVHLVLPRESLFTERERDAKAAVLLKLRGNGLSERAGIAVRNLVASAVDNLRPENVSVVNADTRVPLLPAGGDLALNSQSSELEAQLTKKIIATLEPVFGLDSVRASVTVEREMSSVEDTNETYDPNSTATLTMQRSEERLGGVGGPSGVPGTSSNVPPAKTVAPSQPPDPGQVSRTENGTYAVNKAVRHLVQPAGRVKKISAAVLLDDADAPPGATDAQRRKPTPEQLKQVEELAKAAIGFDAARGDIVSVRSLPFRQEAPPAVPALRERVFTFAQRQTGILRYAALAALFVVIYLVLLRPIKHQALAAFRQLPGQINVRTRSLAGTPGELLPSGLNSQVQVGMPELAESTDPEAKRAVMLKRQLVEKIKSEPANASRFLQTWIRQDEGQK